MTPQGDHETGYEDEASEELHDEILSSEDPKPAILRGENGRLLRGSPQMFYDKLTKKLADVGIEMAKLDYRTTVDDPPPCYSMAESDYSEWMRLAAVELVPIRYDLPGEPNYCHDCTPQFKGAAMKAGKCMFPNTRFEVRKSDGEKETIGVSRSHSVPPENYVVYQRMTVPLAALHEKIQAYVKRRPRKKTFTRADLPKEVQVQFERINRRQSEEAE